MSRCFAHTKCQVKWTHLEVLEDGSCIQHNKVGEPDVLQKADNWIAFCEKYVADGSYRELTALEIAELQRSVKFIELPATPPAQSYVIQTPMENAW